MSKEGAEMDTIKEIKEQQMRYFLKGSTYSLKWRKEQLLTLRRILKENEEVIGAAVYSDFKKSFFEVRQNELGLVYAEISKALKHLNRWARPEKPFTSIVNIPGKSRVYPIPFGNVFIIAPWNYPVQLALIPVVSALAAGNTVILKPSELTSHTSGVLAKILNEAFSKEVLYVRTGGVTQTQELLELKFDKIFFTGSTKVGKIVMRAAAEHLTPVVLELGGKNPVIVMPDCDLSVTAKRLVWGKFHNGGQACVSPDHIYVHEEIKDAFVEEVKLNIKKMYKGEACNSEAFPGIVNKANFNRLQGLITQEKLAYGGRSEEDTLCFEPTVLVDVSLDDPVMQDEVFGPIMPILTYDDLDNLLIELKKAPSPLAFYLFTKNKNLAEKIQREFRSGGGMINDTVVHFVNGSTPFGGIGESGMGNYHGKAGFDCFSHRKTVLSKPLWFELWVKYPPYTKGKLKIIQALLR